MPDHVHVLLEPSIKETVDGKAVFYSLGEIFQSIKAHTARQINKAAGTKGKVWEEEWFDRLIRSERDLQEKFHYITRNPFDAGLAEEDAPLSLGLVPGIFAEDNSARERRADCTPRRADSPSSPEKKTCAQIFVGTHALLFEPEGLQNPGLVVIDEQHKFGVAQRGRLTTQEPAPDVLVMTATPIPRTLTMSLYGDLDVSTIDEMPADRGRIVTAARDVTKLPEVLDVFAPRTGSGPADLHRLSVDRREREIGCRKRRARSLRNGRSGSGRSPASCSTAASPRRKNRRRWIVFVVA